MAPATDQFAHAVRELIPINGLPEQHQEEILSHGKVIKYRKGRYVFKQGDKDNSTFFILEGELELIADGQLVKQVASDTPDARHALAQLQPRQLSARAKTPLQVFKIDRTVLDRLLSDDRFDDEASQVEVSELVDDSDGDWMTRMLGSDLFSRLPAANIQSVFTNMEAMDARAGDVILEQGATGEYYFIIQTGRCLVTRKSEANGKITKLAELGAGDCFGEEALVSESKRNATVTMLTHGQLMRLAKRDFNELIKKPTLNSVTYNQAVKLAKEGAVWLDVRFADEHKATGIADSTNLPLNILRSKMRRLDAERRYIVYCDSGGRSSAGAFLLAQRGFDACYLAGGLIHSPMGEPAKKPAARAPVKNKAPAARKQAITVPNRRNPVAPSTRRTTEAPRDRRGGDPNASQAQQIARELTQVKRELETMRKLKSESDAARAAVERAMGERLRKERGKIEADALRAKTAIEESQRLKKEIFEIRKSAEKDGADKAGKRRALDRNVADSEKRLLAEKKRLETDFQKTARELAELQQKRDKAETQLREEMAALEGRSHETERRLAEALRLKEKAEAARRAAEEAMEDSLRTTRAQLEADAKRHKESAIELERLRKEVENARKAVEADRSHKQSREDALQGLKRETETRLREEEKQLKSEHAQLQQDLAGLQKMKEQAEQEIREEREALKRAAEDASKRLTQAQQLEQELETIRLETERSVQGKREELVVIEKRLRADEKTMKERVQETLAAERKKLEAELAGSREALARAQRQARESAEAERRAAEREAERVIAEYKKAHEAVLAEELDKLRVERGQLEGEAERAQRTLAEAQRIQREALKSQQSVHEELDKLRSGEKRAGQEKAQLTARIQELEKRSQQAAEELQAMDRVSRVAEAARDATAAELAKQQKEEDRLLDDRNRIMSPEKLAELKSMRDKLAGAPTGSGKGRKKA
ncbi:MAG: cyclic nucleotide-binding domain-containing protein [Gammaproteobacteria bacterium]|jgi:CRP-like cAMP-binding protein|nr:cyclic nucleotide-binding domain-containing protein [Gammaproteobacteria bacterium]